MLIFEHKDYINISSKFNRFIKGMADNINHDILNMLLNFKLDSDISTSKLEKIKWGDFKNLTYLDISSVQLQESVISNLCNYSYMFNDNIDYIDISNTPIQSNGFNMIIQCMRSIVDLNLNNTNNLTEDDIASIEFPDLQKIRICGLSESFLYKFAKKYKNTSIYTNINTHHGHANIKCIEKYKYFDD
jgi:hypothetical protein